MKLPLGRVADFIRAEGSFDRDLVAMGYSIDSRTAASGRPTTTGFLKPAP